MRINVIANITIIAAMAMLLVPLVSVNAAGLVPCGGAGEPDCNPCYLLKTFSNVYYFILVDLTPPAAVILFIYGGIMYLTSGGSDDRLKNAKKIFLSTIIGLLIIYGSWLIVNTVVIVLGGNIDGFTAETWYSFDCAVGKSSQINGQNSATGTFYGESCAGGGGQCYSESLCPEGYSNELNFGICLQDITSVCCVKND